LRLEISRTAHRELEAAFEYLNTRNPRAARSVRSALRSAMLSLLRLPGRGRPGRVEGTRELVVRGAPYVLVYLVRNGAVFIVRIRHTSQDPSP
jgi:toxin ParE1/3/4